MLPKMSATPKPPKIGSVARRRLPKIIAMAVSIIGFERVAVATAIARCTSIPFAIKDREKSIRSNELLALIPISEIKPIKEVAVRKKLLPVKISCILSLNQ